MTDWDVHLTVQEVSGHQQFKSYLGRDWELRNLCAAVRVADFVGEVHADLLQDVGTERNYFIQYLSIS